MKTEFVGTESGLQRLRPEWDDLLAASGVRSPFLTWEWCSTWWRHYGAGHDLAVVVLREGTQVVGLGPLYVHRGGGWRLNGVMRFLGSGEVCSEYLGFLLRPGREADGTRSILQNLLYESPVSWRQLRLAEVPAGGAAAESLAAQLPQCGRPVRVQDAQVAWFVELAGSWDDFLAKLSRNRREKMRRARRDMEKHRLEFHEAVTDDELAGAWSELKRLHQLRWRSLGQPGCFASKRFDAFHTDLLRPLSDRGLLSLTTLRRGDATIAASYCLRHGGHVSFYQGGVDPNWMHCRPGHSLRVCELRRAIERGDRIYDFLGGEMEYKQQWATHQAAMLRFTVGGASLGARLQTSLESAALRVRGWTPKRLRDAVRRLKARWSNNRPSSADAAQLPLNPTFSQQRVEGDVVSPPRAEGDVADMIDPVATSSVA
jgi:CelD/BcsL family acetyltransferase involved in cellulose biosynthesis